MQRVELNEENSVKNPCVTLDPDRHSRRGCRGWCIVSQCGREFLNEDGSVTLGGARSYFPSENAAKHFLSEWIAEQTRIGNKPEVMAALNTLTAYMRESGYGRATISANGGASFELEA